jgi:proteasome lid subunit RPN8/RPN11
MARLVIDPADLEAIGREGEARYPEEGCGFLLGRTGGGATVVERVAMAANAWREGRRIRFTIHPEAVLAVHKEAEGEGLEVVGVFHSHPDQPAVPSEIDREGAWPGWSYVIVSVRAGRAAGVRSWRLADDRERFEEETIEEETIGKESEL